MRNLPFTPDLTVIPEVTMFFDEDSNTFSYVVKDPQSQHCAIVDSVMDFDYASGSTAFISADQIIEFVQDNDLIVDWIIETHVHADHLSAAPYLQEKLGGKIAIGKAVITVQNVFGKVFNEGTEFQRDGSQFDILLNDGDSYQIGQMTAYAIETPGHTPACMTHIMGDAAFVGDTLFMPDGGTARADFPGGDAKTLYQSIQRLFLLPDETRLFMCHDYAPNGRNISYLTTVAEEKAHNIHVGAGNDEATFVAMREARDKTLGMPRLILPSLQVNMRAGELPPPEDNQQRYFKIPINAFNAPTSEGSSETEPRQSEDK